MPKPRYPIYIPSKGRYESCHTARFLAADKVPHILVVNEHEYDEYDSRYGKSEHCSVLVLPVNDHKTSGLIFARNWIKRHSIDAGYERHWQLDDNIWQLRRWYKGDRIECDSNYALACTEDFVDRYENVAIAGLNYYMFGIDRRPPFCINVHVYSCTLVLNSIPHKWRLRYNDDTDICLQVLSDGWCTILMNVFLANKCATMQCAGGNTNDLYQDDGRLKMARSLERMWPGVAKTTRRFGRPQHVINWKKFNNKLIRRNDLDWSKFEPNEYGMKLKQVAPEIKSKRLRQLVSEFDG